jgi:hypothetical protein
MLIDRQAIGALNFYARSEDAFGDEDIRIAAMFAGAGSARADERARLLGRAVARRHTA